MTIEELLGDFTIKGINQDAHQSSYQGTLQLSIDQNKRIVAKWQIGKEQIQQGTGFFKDNILVINFWYSNDLQETFKGVVVYKCLSTDVLDGFWSEKHGDPQYLGIEQAFRTSSSTLLQ